MKMNLRRGRRLALLLVLVHAVGCGPGGPRRYDISGNVMFEGKPVPAGSISFDSVEGGVGGGFAEIRDGKYDTSRDGRGHLGGEHRVQISGNTGELLGDDPDISQLRELFSPYQTTVDLPGRATTMDFDVPAGGGR